VFKEATAAIVSLISQQIDESIQVVTVAEQSCSVVSGENGKAQEVP
jgi:hypothetical protein